MAHRSSLDQFLAGLERRAYRIAQLRGAGADDALDIVQDAMLSFVRHYAERPEAEWKPLFYRVLENKVLDFHRRETVRRRWRQFTSRFSGDKSDDDPVQEAEDPQPMEGSHQLHRRQVTQAVYQAVQQLPARQQQAFTLRCWEGMSTAETAQAMNCSEGSVKTHYSRALAALKQELKEFGDDSGFERAV